MDVSKKKSYIVIEPRHKATYCMMPLTKISRKTKLQGYNDGSLGTAVWFQTEVEWPKEVF